MFFFSALLFSFRFIFDSEKFSLPHRHAHCFTIPFEIYKENINIFVFAISYFSMNFVYIYFCIVWTPKTVWLFFFFVSFFSFFHIFHQKFGCAFVLRFNVIQRLPLCFLLLLLLEMSLWHRSISMQLANVILCFILFQFWFVFLFPKPIRGLSVGLSCQAITSQLYQDDTTFCQLFACVFFCFTFFSSSLVSSCCYYVLFVVHKIYFPWWWQRRESAMSPLIFFPPPLHHWPPMFCEADRFVNCSWNLISDYCFICWHCFIEPLSSCIAFKSTALNLHRETH